MLFVVDTVENRNQLMWTSKRIKKLVKSTLAAETFSLVEAASIIVLLAKFIEEILLQIDKLHITCFTDSKGLYNAVNATNIIIGNNDWESKWQLLEKYLIIGRQN